MTRRLSGGLLCAVTFLAAQPGAVVTETTRVRIDGRMQTVRRINGRWWSPDNRQLSRTSSSIMWTISGGNAQHLVQFNHHFPVDPAKVNSLDRSMGPHQVRSILGEPNRIFPSDRPEKSQTWDYFGAGGFGLSIHFSSDGGIFTASSTPDGKGMPKEVSHLAFRFNGKTNGELFEEMRQKGANRAAPQSPAEFRSQAMADATRRRGNAPSRLASSGEGTLPAAPDPPPSRIVTAAELERVAIGMSRESLIKLLGEPASRMAIAGVENAKETLRDRTGSGANITIVLLEGKVSALPR